MTRRVYDVDSRRRTLAMEDPQPDGHRLQVIVRGRAVDELTRRPVLVPLVVRPAGSAFESSAARALVNPRQATGGLVGLVGTPLAALPRADVQPYQIGVQVDAGGYHPFEAVQSHGPVATLPAAWSPLDLGNLTLHRMPLRLVGRVMQSGTPPTPLDQAQVQVTHVWRDLPTPISGGTMLPARLVSLQPPIYAARTKPAAALRAVTLAAAAGQDKVLRAHAVAGSRELRLSDSGGTLPGTLLRLDPADGERTEVIPVELVDGVGAPSANPSWPATVTLHHPLALDHREGSGVEVVQETGSGPPRAFDVSASPHDRCVLLAAMGGLGAPTTVRIDGTAPQPEFHGSRPLDVETSPDGYYRLPPIDRVGQLRLAASKGALAAPPRELSADLGREEQSIDFVLS